MPTALANFTNLEELGVAKRLAHGIPTEGFDYVELKVREIRASSTMPS